MNIAEHCTKEILDWLDDETGNLALMFEKMALSRCSDTLIRQLQAEMQDAWHAGIDAGREQGKCNEHCRAEAHCATCSCTPGMTPAIRFDTTPAERDGVVRDHLIRMGWSPPDEAQLVGVEAAVRAFWRGYNAASIGAGGRQQGRTAAGVAAVLAFAQQPAPQSAPVGDSLLQTALRNLPQYISKSGLVGPDMHSAMQCVEVLRDALAQQPAPVAPVGVEELACRIENYHWDVADKPVAAKFAAELRNLAQQPAACGTCGEAIRPDALTGTTCKCAQRLAAPRGEAVAWEWECVGNDPYPRGQTVARALHEMDPQNPPYPATWRPTRPLVYGDAAPQQPAAVECDCPIGQAEHMSWCAISKAQDAQQRGSDNDR